MTARDQSDAVALADDQPRKPAFPWPFADRKPSFVPKSITPGTMDKPPTVWASEPDRMWPYWLAGALTLMGVAFAVCAYVWRA